MAALYTVYRNYDLSDQTYADGFGNLPAITAVEDPNMGETYDWSRTGYTFLGWNTARDGSGTMYQPGASPVDGNYYAQWQEAVVTPDVTITYNNSTIATMNASGTEVLETNGKMMADDITIEYTKPTPSLQAKTGISPSTSSQTITPDSGYDGLSSVQINAMPSGSATAPATITGTDASVSTVANTLTLSKTVSVTPNVNAGYIAAGTSGNSAVSLSATVNAPQNPSLHVGSVINNGVTISPRLLLSSQSGGLGTYYPPDNYYGTSVQINAADLVSGILSITQNDSYDVTNYQWVNVNVSGGGGQITVSPFFLKASIDMPMGNDKTFTVIKGYAISSDVYLYTEDYVCHPGMSVNMTDLAIINGYAQIIQHDTEPPLAAVDMTNWESVGYYDTEKGSTRLIKIPLPDNVMISYMGT